MKKISQLISQDLSILLAKQANLEYQTSFLYLNYAYWFDNQNFEGIGHFFKAESENERKHAIQIFDYLNVRGQALLINPESHTIKVQFEKPGEVFDAYCAREHLNYSLLDEIGKKALEQQETLTVKFIGAMLQDQAKSCDEADKIQAKSKAYSSFPGLYFHLDEQLNVKTQSFDTWKV